MHLTIFNIQLALTLTGVGLLQCSSVTNRLYQRANCACSDSVQPVCGSDNVDYANPMCARTCGGVTEYRFGRCNDVKAAQALAKHSVQLQTRQMLHHEQQQQKYLSLILERQQRQQDTSIQVMKEEEQVENEPEVEESACNCTMEYRPVCGEKYGVWTTYGNQCFARCARVKDENVKQGECISGRLCNCPNTSTSFVCARRLDGTNNDYKSRCFARCDQAFIVDLAPCNTSKVKPDWADVNEYTTGECHCSNFYMPVCGYQKGTWRTYMNSCLAYCFHVEKFKMGTCEEYSRCPGDPNNETPVAQQHHIKPVAKQREEITVA